MFDVKQLRVLKAVAEHGSFSAAADALSYTQPAISQQIAALEKRAGTTLVDRGTRGVRLTDAGQALVEHADVVIARLAAAEAELEAIAGVRGGRVRLSSFPTAGASLLPPAVAEFTRRHPEVELNVVQGLIAAGVGISLLPGLALTNVREDIVVRSLGKNAPARRIASATLAGRYRSPATEAMLELLAEVAERFELPGGAAVAA